MPVVDSALATANAVAQLMLEGRIAPAPRGESRPHAQRLDFLVTDLPKSFAAVASRFLGEAVPEVHQIDLG